MSREAKKLLIVLLAIDFLFIAIHLAYSLPRYTFNSLLQIDVDGGYAETYEYVKEATVALLLALVALRKRSLHLAAWSLLFLFSLVDDALQFHETLGKFVDGWIVPSGIDPSRPSSEVAAQARMILSELKQKLLQASEA